MANQLKKIQISLIKCIFYICWEKTNIGCAIECGSRTFNSLFAHDTIWSQTNFIYTYIYQQESYSDTK